MNRPKRIGFIGAGRIAQALASGIIRTDPDVQLVISDPSPDSRQSFLKRIAEVHQRDFDFEVETAHSNARLFADCPLVFLAIKPQHLKTALHEINPQHTSQPVIVSVMAGVPIAAIEQLTGCLSVVRIMTNTPCLVGHGASAMACSPSVEHADRLLLEQFLSSIGIVEQIDETLMDAVTGMAGSGPAYVFQFVESLVQGGVLAGLPPTVAHRLAVQTILGAATMAQQTQEHPAILRDQVSSPGGTTIAGLKELEAHGFRNAVMAAVNRATERARELGKYFTTSSQT